MRRDSIMKSLGKLYCWILWLALIAQPRLSENMPYLGGKGQVDLTSLAIEAMVDDLVILANLSDFTLVVGSSILGKHCYH